MESTGSWRARFDDEIAKEEHAQIEDDRTDEEFYRYITDSGIAERIIEALRQQGISLDPETANFYTAEDGTILLSASETSDTGAYDDRSRRTTRFVIKVKGGEAILTGYGGVSIPLSPEEATALRGETAASMERCSED